MAHYYFDMADAGTFYDEDGLDYKDDAEASTSYVRAHSLCGGRCTERG